MIRSFIYGQGYHADMPSAPPPEPFFLIVADYDQRYFSVEGPMTDDRPWKDAALKARNHQRQIECGPVGPDRVALATDYHRNHKLSGVPPGSIVRVRR
jgi:hypothetical protein